MTRHRHTWFAHFAATSLFVAAASCGARTAIDLPLASEVEPDAGSDATPPARDSGGPGLDSSRDTEIADTLEDRTTGDGYLDADASDAPPEVGPPPTDRCENAPGLQPGAPWPIAYRCSARAASTLTLGPGGVPTVAWQASSDAGWGSDLVIAADGTLYASRGDGVVVAMHSDGGTQWTAPLPGAGIWPVYFAIGVDGTVYAWDGTLTALRPDGSQLWSLVVTSSTANLAPAVGPDGTLYVAGLEQDSQGNSLAELSAVSPLGLVLWQASFDMVEPYSFPAVGPDGTVYLIVASTAGTVLYAVTPQGALAWSAPLTGENGGASLGPVIVGDDGTVYASCGAGACSFAPNGQPGATFGDDAGSLALQIALAPQAGLVYETDTSSNVAAFTQNGQLVWSFVSANPGQPDIAFADGRSTLFLSGSRVSFEPPASAIASNGAVVWTSPSATFTAIGSDGSLYGVSSDGTTITALAP